MERSPYLVQALQALGAPPPANPYGLGATMQDVAKAIDGRRAAQPYDPLAPVTVTPQAGVPLLARVGHNLANAPGNVAGSLKGLFSLGGS